MGNAVGPVNVMLELHENCEILCITEHWKSEEQLKSLTLNNFNLISMFCREENKHGGAAVYCKHGLKCKAQVKLNNLSISGVFECAVIECSFPNCREVIVASVYRPPSGDTYIFMTQLEHLLVKVFRENKHIFVLGDFNIEMLVENEKSRMLLSLLNSFNLTQTVFENTRITKDSATCLDNIFTNKDYKNAVVCEHFISDHSAQKITFGVNYNEENHNYYVRKFTDRNKTVFLGSLGEQDWAEVYNIQIDDVNKQWNTFMNTFKVLFNQSFPLKLAGKKTKSNCIKM